MSKFQNTSRERKKKTLLDEKSFVRDGRYNPLVSSSPWVKGEKRFGERLIERSKRLIAGGDQAARVFAFARRL